MQKLARIIMETEMLQKHSEKRKITKILIDLKDSLGLILFNAVVDHFDQSSKLQSVNVSQ